MNMASILIFTFICLFSFSSAFSSKSEAISPKKADTRKQKSLETYIVYVTLPDGVESADQFEGLERWYHSFLPRDATGVIDVSRIVFSYRQVINGFAARLSSEEVEEMEKKEGFLDARPRRILNLHTTHSHNYMGLRRDSGLWPQLGFGRGVIIGILDNGIKPDHPSFSADNIPPPPPTWKGKCDFKAFVCNNKIIGGRKFVGNTTGEPVDEGDHGTHTASTAAGNFVENAGVFDNIANGTAVGMAPYAHLAIYQVCVGPFCSDESILAGIDAALEDGVDMLSISLGVPGGHLIPFYDEVIDVGAFRAIQSGIFVSCAAGNSGPEHATLANEAPWILTVGASSIDRNIRATVILGNNEELNGESVFPPKDFSSNFLPLVYPGQNGDESAAACVPGSLNSSIVRGKAVLCEGEWGSGIQKGQAVKAAGGAAMILMNYEFQGYTVLAEAHVLPATDVSFAAGQAIKAYINSTSTPTAKIMFKGTILGIKNAPEVAGYSSRGPNLASPGILKPDIIGPGLNILAAWPYSVDDNTKSNSTSSTFFVDSGTSMSCPHLTGIAAWLKSANRNWSTAAIKSAIMTTANILDLNNNLIRDERRRLPADVFAVGAGHVNPLRAADPGLVYDIKPDDYIPYLCGLGYKDQNIMKIVNHPVSCSNITSIPEAQLNYPSFAIQLGTTTQTYSRTLTNVGTVPSTYEVKIDLIPMVDVIVQPRLLIFTQESQKLTYAISFTRKPFSFGDSSSYVQGAITWISKNYTVRSPISVKLV